MPLRQILAFHLPAEFPRDCGWLDAVRNRRTDSTAATYLRERHPALVSGQDPSRVIADWQPLGGRMYYYLRQKSDAPCQFLATDGVFAHTVSAIRADWRSFSGPVGEFLDRCHELCRENLPPGVFPLMPLAGGYPGAVVLHELARGQATLATTAVPAQPRITQPEETPCPTTLS